MLFHGETVRVGTQDITELLKGMRSANIMEHSVFENRVDHLLYTTKDHATLLIVGPDGREGTAAILKEPLLVAGSYYNPQLQGFLYKRDGGLLLRPEPGTPTTPLVVEHEHPIPLNISFRSLLGLGDGELSRELRKADVLSPAALEAKIRAYDPALRT